MIVKLANSITNQFQDFHVQNLCQLVHHVEGRGPFIVTQDGAAPDDPRMRQCSFVLTKRGTWLHFYLYLALPEVVRDQLTYFDAIAAIIQRAETLSAKVVVEDASSLQDLLHETGFKPEASDLIGQALLREVSLRHSQKAAAES
ncbi:MAG: hypothetical protein JNN07_15780 [Verrucomicrobiales bacterium]|nr:hypothetical protein [Verrucomicrobiales bacterium]